MTTPAEALAAVKPINAKTARILTIDIERLPGTARFFDLYRTPVRPHDVEAWPRTICFAARWYGHKTPIFAAEWQGRERMVETAWELYDKADIVYTYNGIRFDDKHLRTAWLEAGMPPPRPWKAVDLFAVVKQFGFESRSLDSVSRRLGRPGKQLHYNADVAFAAVNGDKTAQRELKTYNIGDIELTEWLADRLRGWMPSHPHLSTLGNEKTCNQCGSQALTLQKTTYRAVIIDYALYRCDDCGANVRGGWHSRAASTRGVKA